MINKYDNSLLIETPIYFNSILTKELIITINKWNIEHLTKLGYENLKQNTKWIIPVEHLQTGSGQRVDCICSECGSVNNLQFMVNYLRSNFYCCKNCNNKALELTMLNKYGVTNASQCEYLNAKRKITCLKKYGKEHVIGSEYTQLKRKEICLKKHGVNHHMKVPEIRERIIRKGIKTKIIRGIISSDEMIPLWNSYKRTVRKLTERNRAKLIELWNGYDYYDNEYIKNNFVYKHLNNKFPTLDHKISILHGFKNNIPVENISDISNLCITKRFINISKSHLNEQEYKLKMHL